MKDRAVVAVLGGGSVWTPRLVQGLAASPLADRLTVRLYGRTQPHLREVASFARDTVGPNPEMIPSPSLVEAVRGADVVLCQVRIGGWSARERDERLPVQLGAVGDESLGIGGLRAAVRTRPFVEGAAPLIRREAPRAWILNLTNPADLVSMMWRRAGCARVLSVCEHLQVKAAQLATLAEWGDGPSRLDVLGAIHVGWITPAEGTSLAPLLRKRPDLKPWIDAWNAVPSPWRVHLADPAALARRQREAPGGRARQLRELAARLREAIRNCDADAYAERAAERAAVWYAESVVPAIEGILGVRTARLVVGCPARQRMPEFSSDLPLDGWTTIGAEGVHPEPTRANARCREDIASFLQQRTAAFEAAVRPAASSIERALASDPFSAMADAAEAVKAVTDAEERG